MVLPEGLFFQWPLLRTWRVATHAPPGRQAPPPSRPQQLSASSKALNLPLPQTRLEAERCPALDSQLKATLLRCHHLLLCTIIPNLSNDLIVRRKCTICFPGAGRLTPLSPHMELRLARAFVGGTSSAWDPLQ